MTLYYVTVSITMIGFILGLIGVVKSSIDTRNGLIYPFATWTNFRQWEPGLKIAAVGIILWLSGLTLKAIT